MEFDEFSGEIADEPEWIEATTDAGLPILFFRAKFMEGQLMHLCVGDLRPIDTVEFEGTFHHFILSPNGTGRSLPSQANLYSSIDEGQESLEIGFRSLKSHYAQE